MNSLGTFLFHSRKSLVSEHYFSFVCSRFNVNEPGSTLRNMFRKKKFNEQTELLESGSMNISAECRILLLWQIGWSERQKKVPLEELTMICKLVLLCRQREHHSVEHFLQDLAFPQHRVVTIDPSYNGYSVLKIWQLNPSFLIVHYIITVQALCP